MNDKRATYRVAKRAWQHRSLEEQHYPSAETVRSSSEHHNQ